MLVDALVEGRGDQGLGVDGERRLIGSGTLIHRRWLASLASRIGSTIMKRDRNVGTPQKVPAPNWAKVWWRPSGVTTLWPAWPPPL